ncbi:DUF4118 domain-containing protein [Streptomyces atratus]|uniref:DUF4118 domain-containing protein n=1 Tax=Streptomyces atratus TaxID=1893 RepID=UPI0022524B0C|nr:DUF4118 domain-containing protein [Streptomyces atratus]MCX5342459.1 DUF4118 domain-containing protein [Streptomyces atratus]
MGFPLRDRIALTAALIGPFLAALVLAPFRTSMSGTNLALLLVVVVVAVSAIGNRWAGAVAALSSAAWFDFFLTQPYQRFSIAGTGDVETAVLLLVVGVAVSQLAARARRLRVITITDADHLARIHDTALLVQSATSPDAVVDHVRHQLVDLLHLQRCRFEYGSLLGQPPRLEQDGSTVVGHRRWDVDRDGWPEGEIELRASASGHYSGRFMLLPAPGQPHRARRSRCHGCTPGGHAVLGRRDVPRPRRSEELLR